MRPECSHKYKGSRPTPRDLTPLVWAWSTVVFKKLPGWFRRQPGFRSTDLAEEKDLLRITEQVKGQGWDQGQGS